MTSEAANVKIATTPFTQLIIEARANSCKRSTKGPGFCHTNVTVIVLPGGLLILTVAADRECRRPPFLGEIRREFLPRNSVSHLGNPQSNYWCRGVIAPAGSPTHIWARADAMPQHCSIFFARMT